LRGADRLMRSALFVGVYPGLTAPMIDYVVETVGEFCRVAAKGRISPP
jgi:dTDP-4-amino-4,6-dideoxygalactose transaminase